ncbi:MAG: hypothetical protein HZB38_06950 [Planctomycetes bacterium]|nr:hypothetical protein [Planctomycetota bacterium]
MTASIREPQRAAGRHFAAVVLAFAVVASAAAQSSEQKADPGAFAPPDAIAMVGVTDLDELVDGFKKTSGYKLMSDPALNELGGEFAFLHRFTQEFAKRLSKALGTESEKLKNPFGGACAFAMLPPGGDSKGPGVVATFGVKDAALMKEYYDKVVANFKNIAEKHESIEFGSHAIDHFTARNRKDREKKSDGDDADLDPNSPDLSSETGVAAIMDKIFGELFTADALPESLAMCLAGDRFVVALSPDEVKNVLRRSRGGESLKDNDEYKSLSRHFESPGPVRLYLSFPRLFDMLKAGDSDGHKEMMNIVGGKCLRALIGHAEYGKGRVESRMEMMVLTAGERSGLMKILTPKNRPFGIPKTISADTSFFLSAALNPPDVVDEIERMVRAGDPDAADQMRESLESVEVGEGEKISIRKDIIANLREPLTFGIGFTKPVTPKSGRFGVSIGHSNKQALERVIEKIKGMTGLIDHDVQGTVVYDMPAPLSLSLCVASDAVIFGTTATVEAALESSAGAGLADDATFKKTMELMPKEGWMLFYVDGRRLFEAIAELAKERQSLMQQMMMGKIEVAIAYGMMASMGEDATPEALRKMAENQNSGAFALTTTADGLRLTGINIAPESR